MEELFERAKRIGLGCVKQWLPDGKQEGPRWVARNPTRADGKLGSFKINLQTGVWGEFADGEDTRGYDTVSLYAYLHNEECTRLASTKGYKNMRGGVNAEAAKLILKNHDPAYFPDETDHFSVKTKKTGWDGFYLMGEGSVVPPELNLNWYEKQWGKVAGSWDFHNAKGRVVMRVVRFQEEAAGDGKKIKKNDRPFTLWTDGEALRWRAKGLLDAYPLWNLIELIERPNDTVLLMEGQKDPAIMRDIVGDQYVVVGWYGGAGSLAKTDLSYLTGRRVIFASDADNVGRMLPLPVLKALDIDLYLTFNPPRVRKGWSIADAVGDGWTKEQINEFLETARPASKEEPVQGGDDFAFLDDDLPLPFKILGISGNRIYFYPFGSRIILDFSFGSLTKNNLIALADRMQWGKYFSNTSGKISWDAALNWVIRQAESKEIFDNNKVRRSGAWMDDGRIIVSTGEYLLVKGRRLDLSDIESDFTYERSSFIPYQVEKALSTGQELKEIVDLLSIDDDIEKYCLLGFLLLSPWCGVLAWRPHFWLSGPKGVGKTWVMQNIILPLLYEYAINATGSSTPPGLKQKLNNSPRVFIADEMDADTKKKAERVNEILSIVREMSSGNRFAATQLNGTSDGDGRSWTMIAMAFFASIGAAIRHGADKDRFTVATLSKSRHSEFPKLEAKSQIINKDWARRFHARTYNIIEEVIKCIDVMINEIYKLHKIKRVADQIGTLLAGAYMVTNDKAPNGEDALLWLMSLGVDKIDIGISNSSDEDDMMKELLTAKISISDGNKHSVITIGEAIYQFFNSFGWGEDKKYLPGCTRETIQNELEQYGIRLDCVDGVKGDILIAMKHPGLKKIFKDSAWPDTYEGLIKRLPYCEKKSERRRFAGFLYYCLKLEAHAMLEEFPF